MLYFITPTGLYSETYLITKGGIKTNTIQPFVNIPITYNKNSIDINLEIEYFDFTKGKSYICPVQNSLHANTIFDIEMEHCCLGDLTFSFDKENVSLKYFFSHIFPYLNSIKNTEYKLLPQTLLIIELLSSKYQAFQFIEKFKGTKSKDYLYYEIVEGRSFCQGFQKISLKRYYRYEVRVGRDDYEYETTYITFSCKDQALRDLLELAIKEDAKGEITITKNKNSIEYSYCSYRDSCFGPAPKPKEFAYSEEQCNQYKVEIIEKIKNKYQKILMQFINSFQTFIETNNIYEQRNE